MLARDRSGRIGVVSSDEEIPAVALPAGSSLEQQAAELLMVQALGVRLHLPLQPRHIDTGEGRVQVDAADVPDGTPTVLAEAWAHQGPLKPAQRHKVLADALKLYWVASKFDPKPALYLCLSDAEAARYFKTGASWAAAALRDLLIHVEVVDLPDEARQAVIVAQRRQWR